jgi:Rrf2 family iron-sulfur cluster assembly transcriptional regulator
MMSLSQTTGYAIQALGCLNDPACTSRQIAEIAKRSGTPKPYLAKIMSSLSQKGLVCAKRGYRGGISLARSPQDISLLEIVEAVEGEHWLGDCLIGFEHCAKHLTCPTQVFWRRIRREIADELRKISLAEVLTANAVKLSPYRPLRRAANLAA